MNGTNVKIGIQTYNYPPEQLLALARAADQLGFEGLWMGEHYVNPASYVSKHPGVHDDHEVKEDAVLGPQVRMYDPMLMLAAVAGTTTRLKLGTAITIVPLVHPLLLAHATASLHDVSGGRFRLGAGAGWLQEEFDALGIPFNERGARLDEAIEILRKAWAGGYFAHSGKHFSFSEEIQVSPHRIDVPLVCGGNSGPALRRVVRTADAWMNSAMVSLPEALELRDAIEKERAAAGKTQTLPYFIRPPAADPKLIESFVKEGFDNIVLWGPHIWPKSAAISVEEKIAHLVNVARELGIAPV